MARHLSLHRLDGRAQAEQQARIRHQARCTGMGAGATPKNSVRYAYEFRLVRGVIQPGHEIPAQAQHMSDQGKTLSFYAFEMLYWCGIRLGELLALTEADFNFEKSTVTITKSYQRINREDIITEPKTPKSNRTIKMPDFLNQEIQDYLKTLYGYGSDDSIFPISKSYLHHEMNRGSKAAGVKRIRVHDIRHSHVSHLIELGFSAVAIADRVGHESIDITYRYYAHMFPSKQEEMADRLDIERGEGF